MVGVTLEQHSGQRRTTPVQPLFSLKGTEEHGAWASSPGKGPLSKNTQEFCRNKLGVRCPLGGYLLWVLSHCQLWKRLALFTFFLPPTWRQGPELRRPGFRSCPYPYLGAAPGTHRAFLALNGLLVIFQLFLAVEAFSFPNEILHANSIFKKAEWGCLDRRRSLPALFPFDPTSPLPQHRDLGGPSMDMKLHTTFPTASGCNIL